jgi:hypothetical protein
MAKATAVIEVPAKITSHFNIAKTQAGFQKIADEVSNLVYNEDNMAQILEVVNKVRAINKKIEEVHKNGKEAALLEGRQWDLAKNTFLDENNALIATPIEKYKALAAEVAERQQKEENEKRRVQAIANGIETNAVAFAASIAACQTTEELLAIERKINLEKTRKDKYDEFLPNAITRFNELNAILKVQKQNVAELERLRTMQAAARLNEDDQAVIDLMEQEEHLESKIEDHKIIVQEAAVNQSMNEPVYASFSPVYASVKAKRTTWKFEMVDTREVMKKNPELLVIELDDAKVKERMNGLKDSGVFMDKTEYTLNGIRYYQEKTFI